jgi:hypothetical protein
MLVTAKAKPVAQTVGLPRMASPTGALPRRDKQRRNSAEKAPSSATQTEKIHFIKLFNASMVHFVGGRFAA